VHFGLWAVERAVQADAVERAIAASGSDWLVLAGDVNDWVPFGRIGRRFDRLFGRVPARSTFPAPVPLLPLDRLWVRPRGSLVRVHVARVPWSRTASDHRPLVAVLEPPGQLLRARLRT
jgi:endonuclease/exonuclease/phosphatase family metal-dependent hydrolase